MDISNVILVILTIVIMLFLAVVVYKVIPNKKQISNMIAERMITEKQLSEFSDSDLLAELRKRLNRRNEL